MRKTLLACACAALGVATVLGTPEEARASSHREAPFITKNPKVDNTDFYMFRSYEAGRDGYVTLIANYLPLQHPYGGPNYFTMDPEALYEIHIDNTGNTQEDITFQFRFSNLLNDATGETGFALPIGPAGATKTVSIPLVNAGGIDATNQFDALRRNVKETYVPKIVRGNRRTGAAADITKTAGPGGATFIKPVDYIGTKSLGLPAAYKAYADAHIYDVSIPGCTAPAGTSARIFVGQRQEGFAVLLGNIFDLVNATAAQLTDVTSPNPNPIGNMNVTTIAVEVPIACLKGAGGDVIGGWSSASVRQARVINPQPSYGKPTKEGGAWAQVSRLGSPLVNEVVIGIKDKDRFNSSEPKDDAQFADYVTNPTLPALVEVLFGPTVQAPTAFPRADLVAAFLTGVPNVNKFPGTSAVAEMLRLNTALPHAGLTTQFRASPSPTAAGLGAAGCFKPGPNPATDAKVLDTALASCDPAGFPNGRRPGDDVVDIALRVVMGYLLPDGVAPAGNFPFGDTVGQHDGEFQRTFPYLNTPNPGAGG